MSAPKSTTVKLALTTAVEFEGVTYTELHLRRMKAKDTLVSENERDETKAGYLLFATLAGVPVEVIGELDIDDLEALSDAVVPLMGKSAVKVRKKAKEIAAARDKELAAAMAHLSAGET